MSSEDTNSTPDVPPAEQSVEEGVGAPLLPAHAAVVIPGTQERQETTGAQQPYTIYEVEVYVPNDEGEDTYDNNNNDNNNSNNNNTNNGRDHNNSNNNNNNNNIQNQDSQSPYIPYNNSRLFCVTYRRFREFHSLYNDLTAKHPEALHDVSFPYRRLWGNMNPETIQYRAQELQGFLKHCMTHADVRDTPRFRQFLQPDTAMLRSAVDYFRSRLCHLRDIKEADLSPDHRNEREKCERHMKYLSRALQEAAREASFVLSRHKTNPKQVS